MKKNISFTILSKTISKQLRLDIKKHKQYPSVEVKEFEEVYEKLWKPYVS